MYLLPAAITSRGTNTCFLCNPNACFEVRGIQTRTSTQEDQHTHGR